MRSFVIIVTKLVGRILQLFGKKAGNVPGRVALALDANICDKITVTGKIIVVTGTNGKTTTTSMLAKVLEQTGKKVVYNRGGNNIYPGITTTLLKNASLSGKVDCDYLILETDEHWVPVLYDRSNLKIDTLVVLDFFRDQLDRAGEMETIIAKLEKFVRKHPCKLVLNGDDPNVVRIGRENQDDNYYYGIDKLESSYKISHDKMEGIICPYCKVPLQYEYYQYSHLGKFRCPKCGYSNAKLATKVTKVDGHDFYVDGEKFSTTNASLYNIYNMLAVMTVADIYGVERATVREVLAKYQSQDGRYQKFEIAGRTCILNLCKNPTGFNVVLRPLKHKHVAKELLLVLNDHINDGFDVSWIWDIDFSEMEGFERIICAGTRAYDMAIPIKCNGYKLEKIVVEHNITRAIDKLLETDNQKYIISNYSPLVQVKETLERLEDKE